MFSVISWADYFEYLFYALLNYYIATTVLYYRKDIVLKFAQWQQGGLHSATASHAPIKVPEKTPMAANPSEDVLFSIVHDLLDELKMVFTNASQKKFHKEELMMALQTTLRKYAQLKGTAFQVAINNHIMQEVEAIKMQLEEKEIGNCW